MVLSSFIKCSKKRRTGPDYQVLALLNLLNAGFTGLETEHALFNGHGLLLFKDILESGHVSVQRFALSQVALIYVTFSYGSCEIFTTNHCIN